ncbi:RNA polymerase sigma factor [Rhodohalobacter sp. 8-1]|uniref:RNA polymerase sigma factor n=1 Tax=Rhodohalobacter sp. 8-1 TaxID=3131972 RepID=UPI0030EDF187
MRESNFKSHTHLPSSETKHRPSPEVDLEIIWKKVRESDEESLGRLFGVTFDSLYSYGYRIIPHSDDVRDAIQEVFFQLWKYRENLSCPNSIRAYLFSSLRHELFNKKKASKRRNELFNKYRIEEFDALINYNSWDEILKLEEKDSKELKRAIENLTPRQQEAIYLKYFEGLSTKELGKVMKMRTQSVYNLVFSAINNLRKFLNS